MVTLRHPPAVETHSHRQGHQNKALIPLPHAASLYFDWTIFRAPLNYRGPQIRRIWGLVLWRQTWYDHHTTKVRILGSSLTWHWDRVGFLLSVTHRGEGCHEQFCRAQIHPLSSETCLPTSQLLPVLRDMLGRRYLELIWNELVNFSLELPEHWESWRKGPEKYPSQIL